MLGYDGGQKQMSADGGVSCSTSDRTRESPPLALRSVQQFRPHDKIRCTVSRAHPRTRNRRHRVLTGDHPCHRLVHWCINVRYRSNVFDHRTRHCVGHGGSCRRVQPPAVRPIPCAHGHLVKGTASESFSFSRTRSCALEASLGCLLVSDAFELEPHGS